MTDLHIMPEMASILRKQSVNATDVLVFRRAVFGDATVSRQEAESLFAINRRIKHACPEWDEFFVEVESDYLVRQAEPEGVISAGNARWLIGVIGSEGIVTSASELELLVKALEIASASPEFLSAFAFDQVRRTVLSGTGPYARSGHAKPGVITAGDVALLRRILYAYGGDGNIAITRSEAEILFDLNDQTDRADNDPAWTDLFVRANANYLMAHTLFLPADRSARLSREKWLDAREPAGSLLGSLVKTLLGGNIAAVRGALQPDDTWTNHNRARADGIAQAERITSDEISWLIDRIGRDGALHANEKALLDFIKAESPQIHADLQPLFEKAARAA